MESEKTHNRRKSEYQWTSSAPESLSEEEMQWLFSSSPAVYLAANEILFTPEEEANKLFILVEGKIRVYALRSDGRELTLDTVGSGILFGETAFTAQPLPRAYAQALEPSVVIPISCSELQELILQHPAVGIWTIRLLSARLGLYQNRLEDLGLKDTIGRLASVILQLIESEGVMTRRGYKLPRHYTHGYLGTLTGTSREAVTRAFAELQDREAVELIRRRIYVKNIVVLKHVAALR